MHYHYPFNKPFHFIETGLEYPNVFGFEVCGPKKLPIEYKKNLYTLHFVISGKGYVGKNQVGENEVFLLRPKEKIEYRPNPSCPWVYTWIEISDFSIKDKLEQCGFTQGINVLHLQSFDEILHLFNNIFNNVQTFYNEKSRKIQYEALTNMILAHIIEQCGSNLKNKEKSVQEINVENIANYIENNYFNPAVTVNFVAKKFSYAPSYLTRLFKKYMNISPCKYITDIRMKRAQELLSKRNMTINQVANAVGFQNQFYFSKTYLKYYGFRPSVFVSNIKK